MEKKKRSFIFYVVTAALLAAGCHFSYMYAGAITDSVIMTLTDGAWPIGPFAILAAVIWALAYRYSKKNRSIFKGFFNFGNTGKAFLLILPVLAYAIISNIRNFRNPSITPEVLASALYAGICEDITWRALPLTQMMKSDELNDRRLMLALILPAAGFGCIHLNNIAAGSSVSFVLLQVLQTFGIGLLFGAVYLRTGDMTMLFAAHILNDLLSFMGQTEGTIGVFESLTVDASLIFDIAFSVFAIAYAFWLVRKSRRPEILSLWDGRWSRDNITESAQD